MKVLCLAIGVSVLAGCAAPGRVTLVEEKSEFSDYKSGSGQVFFYRPCKFAGVARGMYVLEEGKKIGALNCSTYFVFQAIPGTYTFAADDWLRTKKQLPLSIVANTKYYIKADLAFGLLDAEPYLEMSNESEAKEAFSYSTLVSLPQK